MFFIIKFVNLIKIDTKGPATADKSEGGPFLRNIQKIQKKIFIIKSVKSIKIDFLSIYKVFWTQKNDSPSYSTYTDIFKSVFLHFSKSGLGCAYFSGFKRFL